MSVCLESSLNIAADQIEPAWEALLAERTRLQLLEDDPDYVSQNLIGIIEEGLADDTDLKTTGDRLQAAIYAAGFEGGFGEAVGISYLTPCNDEFTEDEHIEFWKIMAPFVKEGSYFIFQDEEASLLRYRFEGGEVFLDECLRLVWDSDEDASKELTSSLEDSAVRATLVRASALLQDLTGEGLKYCITDMKNGIANTRAKAVLEGIEELLKR